MQVAMKLPVPLTKPESFDSVPGYSNHKGASINYVYTHHLQKRQQQKVSVNARRMTEDCSRVTENSSAATVHYYRPWQWQGHVKPASMQLIEAKQLLPTGWWHTLKQWTRKSSSKHAYLTFSNQNPRLHCNSQEEYTYRRLSLHNIRLNQNEGTNISIRNGSAIQKWLQA